MIGLESADLAIIAAGSNAVPEQTTRTDTVGSYTYIGKAAPGLATSAAVWQIKRLEEEPDGNVTILWADGNAKSDNVWNNRASLGYS